MADGTVYKRPPPSLGLAPTEASPSPGNAPTLPGDVGWLAGEPIELGARMGRYELRSIVGAGGMGVVFEARDPELDRTVAVKVLRNRSGDDSEGAVRLRREGQTMAKLTHPNVIRVYDVGVAHGHVFVAMEFVAGATLADWLTKLPRTNAEILAAFALAGRGLAAAHAAGLVHRDFKPQNVLVGEDGRVLVTDFGLARAASDDPEPPATADAATAPTVPPRRPSLTRTGQFVGTPAYMAPEQYASAAVDARADQFSFCVSLWRALYGIAPYEGETLDELASSSSRGQLTPPPPATASRVSSPIRTALERGLRSDPDQRFPSMDELLLVLEPAPSRRRAWLLAAACAAIVAAAVGWALLRGRSTRTDPCPAPDARIATVWSDARKASLRQHLTSIDPATGAQRFAAAAAVFDRAVPTWRAMTIAACRATRVDGRQSDSLLDARMRCLDDSLDQLGALATDLERAPGPAELEGAIKGLGGLGSIERCADVVKLQAAANLPTDPAAHAAAVAIVDEVHAINKDRRAGKLEGLAARADDVLARARMLDNTATSTIALAVRWRVAMMTGDVAGAIGFLHELTEVAARGHDDNEAANAWALMGRLTAFSGKADQAKVMLTAARAAAASAGDPPDLDIEVLSNEADVLNAAGDGEGALADLARARGLLEQLGADKPGSPYAVKLGGLLQSLGEIYWFSEQLDQAVPALRQAIEIFDRAFGPDTVESAGGYLDLAQVLLEQRDFDAADQAVQQAVRIRELRTGQSAALAMALLTQAEIAGERGKVDDAIAIGERSIKLAHATMPPDDPQLAELQASLATNYDRAGRAREALAIYVEVLAAVERAGTTGVNVAEWWLSRADLERRLGECKDAIPHFVKGADAGRDAQGDDSGYILRGLGGEGVCLHTLGRDPEAIDRLTRAIAIKVGPMHATQLAYTRGLLGTVLVDSGRDRARGLALVHAALDELHAAKLIGDEEGDVKQLETWSAKHPR